MALTASTMLPLGTKAPNFHLPDVVSGQTISLDTFAGSQALLVMFICRHCIVPYLTGCNDRLKDAELERLRQEAIAQNATIIASQEQERTLRDWRFVVQGQTSTGKPVQLSWSKLEALATTSIWTQEPHNTSTPKAILHFRGIGCQKLRYFTSNALGQ